MPPLSSSLSPWLRSGLAIRSSSSELWPTSFQPAKTHETCWACPARLGLYPAIHQFPGNLPSVPTSWHHGTVFSPVSLMPAPIFGFTFPPLALKHGTTVSIEKPRWKHLTSFCRETEGFGILLRFFSELLVNRTPQSSGHLCCFFLPSLASNKEADTTVCTDLSF